MSPRIEANPKTYGRGRRRRRRRRRAMADTLPDLPRDTIIDILTRLPVKTLMRFRCVCKSWHALITDPNFIDAHRNQTCASNKGYMFIQTRSSPVLSGGSDSFSLHCDETFVELVELKSPLSSECFHVAGYCHGVFCISPLLGFELCFGQDIYLWNPAIQKFKALPNSSRHGNALCLAFGFFPRDNDYKVLKVFEGEERHKPAETEIYSLRANSWRRMQSVMPGKISYSSLETIHNGVLHCCGYRETGSHFILWVDMANEVFGEIKLPKCFCDQDDDDDKWSPIVDMFVRVSRKSLCLFFNDVSHGSMDVWVMKEYGVPESWTKQCSIGRPINSYAYPIGLMKNGEVVLKGYRGGGTHELLSYDQRVQEFKDIRIHGEPKFVKVFTHYMESLVLLNEGN